MAWWKWLGVAILLVTLTVGMLVPLKPGVEYVSPGTATAGQTLDLAVYGYNTHFEAGTNQGYLGLNVPTTLEDSVATYYIPATATQVSSDNRMTLRFVLPDAYPTTDSLVLLNLLLQNQQDGAFVLPGALSVANVVAASPEEVSASFLSAVDLVPTEAFTFPYRSLLGETIRNTYFHVPMWFGMILLFTVALVYQVRYLRKGQRPLDDAKAVAFVEVGVVFGLLGIVTGSLWARYTWGQWWSFDIKQNMAAIALLIYLAYFVLRDSFSADPEKKARTSALYGIYAYAAMIPLLFVIPRLTSSLHPGSGGNPGFGGEDLDNTMRMIFYPAIIGWTLLGAWAANIRWRTLRLRQRIADRSYSRSREREAIVVE